MYKFLPLLAATELKRVNPLFGEQDYLQPWWTASFASHCSYFFIWGVSL